MQKLEGGTHSQKSWSEKRYYTTRGSSFEENVKIIVDGNQGSRNNHNNDNGVIISRRTVWPKVFISLSSKEKEEYFMAMKVCKLPQWPKKRAKLIQRTLLVS